MAVPFHLLVCDDESVLADTRERLLCELVGADRACLVRFSRGMDLSEVLLARSLFSERNVVDVRSPSAEQVAVLVEFLANPDPEVAVVVSVPKAPAKLSPAVKKAGGHVEVISARSADTARELVDRCEAPLTASAKRFMLEHYASDLTGLLAAVRLAGSMFDGEQKVGEADLVPLVGDAGSLPPWAVCDAIDAREVSRALQIVRRQLTSVPAIAVLAGIRSHVQRLFYAQNVPGCDQGTLADLTGYTGPQYPLTKALRASRTWGDASWALTLVGEAEHAVRGGSRIPAGVVVDILVARLARR